MQMIYPYINLFNTTQTVIHTHCYIPSKKALRKFMLREENIGQSLFIYARAYQFSEKTNLLTPSSEVYTKYNRSITTRECTKFPVAFLWVHKKTVFRGKPNALLENIQFHATSCICVQSDKHIYE